LSLLLERLVVRTEPESSSWGGQQTYGMTGRETQIFASFSQPDQDQLIRFLGRTAVYKTDQANINVL